MLGLRLQVSTSGVLAASRVADDMCVDDLRTLPVDVMGDRCRELGSRRAWMT